MKLIKDVRDLKINSIIYAVYRMNDDIHYYEVVIAINSERNAYTSRILSEYGKTIGSSEWPFEMYDIYELNEEDVLKLVSDVI